MPSASGGATGCERHRTLATDQTRDSFVHVALGPHVRVRLLSQRCQEAYAQALPNQDYALVDGGNGGRTLAFCVCDGVGSSYKGDFAASYLAMRLVSWLAALPPPGAATEEGARGDEASLHARLTAELLAWSQAGQEELRRLIIPPATDALVREVLEELREGYGSEVVFLAGRVDRPAVPGASDAPDASGAPYEGAGSTAGDDLGHPVAGGHKPEPAHLVLCWMGNVTAQIVSAVGPVERLWAPGDDRDRWSTARGLCGALQVVTSVVPALHRLIVHTDGADSLSASLAALSDSTLQDHVRRLQGAVGSDDITILDIRWDDAREGDVRRG